MGMNLPSACSPPGVYAPIRTLMLHLTEDCNLRCSYCFVKKSPRRMGSETARKAVEFFLARSVSGAEYDIHLNFFGGEPFLELDRMEEVIAFARQPRPNVYKNVIFSATTNGTIASGRVERMVREARMNLLISLDGDVQASGYRRFASGQSSYGVVSRNLPRLVSWSPEASVRMSFHPGALDLVGQARHGLDLGAPLVVLAPILDADWHDHVDALEGAFQALADWFIAEARQGRILALDVTHRLLQQYHHVLWGSPRPVHPCRAGSSLLGVDPDGNVLPCHRFLYRPEDWLGTVEQVRLPRARQRHLQASPSDSPGCEVCPATSICCGGCQAIARNAGLGWNEIHPSYCIVMQAQMRAILRIYHTLTAEAVPCFFQQVLQCPRIQTGALTEPSTR